MPELLVKPFFGQMANDYPDNHFMTISPGKKLKEVYIYILILE